MQNFSISTLAHDQSSSVLHTVSQGFFNAPDYWMKIQISWFWILATSFCVIVLGLALFLVIKRACHSNYSIPLEFEEAGKV